MLDLFWDLYQQRRIDELQQRSDETARRATDVHQRIRQLEDQVDRLALINQAMWSVLSQATGVTQQQLAERVNEIDLQDGVADGKVTRTPAQCPKCLRKIAVRHQRCIYCGQEMAPRSAFDRI